MDSSGRCSSRSVATSSAAAIDDLERPYTKEELEAIDEAINAATSKKRQPTPQIDSEIRPKTVRRLPSSMLNRPQSLFPCQAEMKTNYPVMKFGGQIIYSRTYMEVEEAAVELLKLVDVRKRQMDWVALGFDIEWKPTFTRGVSPGKAAVMQICCDTSHCHVMHIIHSGIPRSLQLLLEDSTVLKVGIGIASDSFKIFYDYSISVKGVEDLSFLADKKFGGQSRKWSLKSLTEWLVSKQLPKPNKIRLGNWEVDILSKAQLQYAATDAFVSWHLYEVLKTLPDTKINAVDHNRDGLTFLQAE